MRWLFCCFLFITTSIHAQQKSTDSTINIDLPALDLTAAQKIALKKLVWEYKLEDRRRRRELRHKMFLILNVRQEHEVRRAWRSQIKNSLKRHP